VAKPKKLKLTRREILIRMRSVTDELSEKYGELVTLERQMSGRETEVNESFSKARLNLVTAVNDMRDTIYFFNADPHNKGK